MKFAAVAAMLAATPVLAQSTEKLTVEEFLRQASADNLADVEVGRMVRNDPSLPQGVHQVGDALAKTSQQMRSAIENIAGRKNVALRGQPEQRDSQMIQRLSQMEGAQFTDQYLTFVIDDLERDISLYQRGTRIDDPAVRAFAQDTLPVLQATRAMAQKVRDQEVAEKK